MAMWGIWHLRAGIGRNEVSQVVVIRGVTTSGAPLGLGLCHKNQVEMQSLYLHRN